MDTNDTFKEFLTEAAYAIGAAHHTTPALLLVGYSPQPNFLSLDET